MTNMEEDTVKASSSESTYNFNEKKGEMVRYKKSWKRLSESYSGSGSG